MTETSMHIAEAIKQCDEVKARLETLQDMLKPKPVLRLESITHPGTYWELQAARELIDCAPGTVIVTPSARFFRTCNPGNPWISRIGTWSSSTVLWETLTRAVDQGATLKYFAAN